MESRKGLLSLHVAVFLFGASGLFGKLIDEPAQVIVLGRTIFASLALALVTRAFSVGNKRDQIVLALSGVLLAVHWSSFFLAIQLSSVAVGLLTFSSFPLFVTLLEPIFFGEKLRGRDLLFALLVMIGLVFVVPTIDLGNQITRGALWGILSGLTFALLSLANRNFMNRLKAQTIAFHQNLFATLTLLPFSFHALPHLSGESLVELAILGIVCTAVAHALFIHSLGTVRATLASITSSLEPVYGIILAAWLLGEHPTPRVLLGGAIILGTTVLATRFRSR